MMQSPEIEGNFDLREYIAILRAHRWTVIVTTVLVIVAALAFSFQQTPLYTAEAKLLVEPLRSTETGSTLPTPVNLETERELVQSAAVAERVKEELGSESPADELLGNVDVEVVIESEVLIVSYTSDDPEFAQQAANAFAQGYIDDRTQQALDKLRVARADVQKEIDDVTEQINDIDQQLADPEVIAEAAATQALEARRTPLLSQLGVLQVELSQLSPRSTAEGGGEIIAGAARPGAPSSPNLLRNGVLAAFLGLALGVGLAFLRERLQDRFKGREDVERQLAAPVLATIPRFATKPKDHKGKLIVRKDPQSLASESYRSLRTNLEFIASTTGRKSFLITSPSAGEGKSVTAANLAYAFAQSGRRTILVSGDLRRPTVEKIFGVQVKEGLSNFLAGQTDDLERIIVNPGITNLRVLPTGNLPPNPAEMMTSPRLAELIEDLEGGCDILLIDSAPTLPVADAAIISAHVGGAVLVINAEGTRRVAAGAARSELSKVGGRLVGAVLNAYDPTTSTYSYYQTYNYDSSVESPVKGNGGLRSKAAKLQRFTFRR